MPNVGFVPADRGTFKGRKNIEVTEQPYVSTKSRGKWTCRWAQIYDVTTIIDVVLA